MVQTLASGPKDIYRLVNVKTICFTGSVSKCAGWIVYLTETAMLNPDVMDTRMPACKYHVLLMSSL